MQRRPMIDSVCPLCGKMLVNFDDVKIYLFILSLGMKDYKMNK